MKEILTSSEEAKAEFALKHGKNSTDRMTPELLRAIGDLICTSRITYEERSLKMLVVGRGLSQDENGDWLLMFDVKKPDDTFDHVEFTIRKTGWGRRL